MRVTTQARRPPGCRKGEWPTRQVREIDMHFKFARTNRIVVGTIILVVSMMYGPQKHAATVSHRRTLTGRSS